MSSPSGRVSDGFADRGNVVGLAGNPLTRFWAAVTLGRTVRAWKGGRVIESVLFDLGDTLIYELVDDRTQLDLLPLVARPHADTVLRRLAGRFSIGLVTDTETSPEPVVRRALTKLGLEKYFAAVVTSEDVGVVKPDRRMFEEALRRLGSTAAAAVMVGNDADRDIAGAAALGMHTVLVTDSEYYDPAKAHVAEAVANTLDEVPSLIEALADRER